jgi:hypothetical protein
MKRTLFLVLVMFSVLMPLPTSNAAGCLAITKWFPNELLSGNEKSSGKLTFVSAAAVKSPDFKNVHFIAVKFKAVGVGNQVGVWALSGKLPQKAGDVSGLILSANSIAQQFTVWPDGNKSQAQIALNDRSIKAATKCLK